MNLDASAPTQLPALGNVYALEHPLLLRQIADEPRPHEDVLHVAMGCYWGAERIFWETPGVTVTAVGFQGGDMPNPTYGDVCTGTTGHAETVRVVFDTTRLSVADILRIFWENHDPTTVNRQGNDIGTQYRSVVFPHSDAQLELALAMAANYSEELQRAGRDAVVTQIIAPQECGTFWFAAPDHQQYLHHNPQGYCMHGPNGVACPMPTGVAFNA